MKCTSMLRVTAVLAVSVLSTAAYAGPNLVTDGGFNSPSYSVNTEFGTSFAQANQQGITGWTGNNGYDLFFTSAPASMTVNALGQYQGTGKEMLWGTIHPIVSSPGGGSFVALDGEQTNGIQGSISQTINGLTIGANYLLSFDWAAAQVQSRTGPTTEQFRVSLGAQSFTTPVVNNPSQDFSGWMNQTFMFTATSTSEALSFLSIGTPLGLPPIGLLDDVSLVQAPEPMSVALLGVALAGLGVARRRKG